MLATVGANGQPAFGQYKPAEDGNGYEPWALQVLELEDGQVARMTFFLEPARLFELWGLPPRLD
jgi:RNA polymerase sigma-70 factor (ECF subfamily)